VATGRDGYTLADVMDAPAPLVNHNLCAFIARDRRASRPPAAAGRAGPGTEAGHGDVTSASDASDDEQRNMQSQSQHRA